MSALRYAHQKLRYDAENTSIATNAGVGKNLMERMGWQDGKGLGKEEQGNQLHVQTQLKNNVHGVGHKQVNFDNNWWDNAYAAVSKSIDSSSSSLALLSDSDDEEDEKSRKRAKRKELKERKEEKKRRKQEKKEKKEREAKKKQEDDEKEKDESEEPANLAASFLMPGMGMGLGLGANQGTTRPSTLSSFVKSSDLVQDDDGNTVEVEHEVIKLVRDSDSDSDDDDVAKKTLSSVRAPIDVTSTVKTLTDDEIFKACGGRRLHRGARRQESSQAKLKRMQEADKLFSDSLEASSGCVLAATKNATIANEELNVKRKREKPKDEKKKEKKDAEERRKREEKERQEKKEEEKRIEKEKKEEEKREKKRLKEENSEKKKLKKEKKEMKMKEELKKVKKDKKKKKD